MRNKVFQDWVCWWFQVCSSLWVTFRTRDGCASWWNGEERECSALLLPLSEHCAAVLFTRDESTSLPGFSPTRPYRARGTGRREPWERGWGRVGPKLSWHLLMCTQCSSPFCEVRLGRCCVEVPYRSVLRDKFGTSFPRDFVFLTVPWLIPMVQVRNTSPVPPANLKMSKAPCKRTQHCWMLYVACCVFLGVVAQSFWNWSSSAPCKRTQIFSTMLGVVASVCTQLNNLHVILSEQLEKRLRLIPRDLTL